MTAALELCGVSAGYPGVPVLREVDLDVPAGSLTAVLGESGCGKTTLLRVVAGFHGVTEGQVKLAGRLVAGAEPGGGWVDVPPERRRIGLVPQEGALFGHLSVAANVGFGLSRADRRGGRVPELLELVGLGGYGRRMPAELSGGQQQRVALARALAPRPALVLLDEPFNALDAGLRAEVRAQVRQALQASGTTAVLVTHDQEEALGTADQVAVLRGGRVVQAGPPRQVYTEPCDIAVGTFVGEAVVVPATCLGGEDAGRVRTVLGTLDVGDPSARGEGRVLVRPEQLRLSAPGNGGMPARVHEVIFHGHDATVVLDRDGHLVRSRVASAQEVQVGEAVSVSVQGRVRFYADA
jgi:iron(III) transport system ATP-binding protein